MNKIAIVGSSGSGKSTLAKQLGHKTNIEVFHLDKLLWKPNWEMTDRNYQIDVQKNLVQKSSWIIDGHFNGTLDIRLSAADTIIFLDRSRYVCIFQAIKRVFMYRNKTRDDMQKSCKETLDFNFLKFIFNFPNKQKVVLLDKLALLTHDTNIITLKNKKDIKKFIGRI